MLVLVFLGDSARLINCAVSTNALANDMYNYYVNHGTAERLFSRSNLNSLLGMANGEAVSRRSLFFHGLLAGSRGYIHQTPSAPIVSLHLRSFDDLQDPFRPFMHTLKYRPLRKFFTRASYVVILSLAQCSRMRSDSEENEQKSWYLSLLFVFLIFKFGVLNNLREKFTRNRET